MRRIPTEVLPSPDCLFLVPHRFVTHSLSRSVNGRQRASSQIPSLSLSPLLLLFSLSGRDYITGFPTICPGGGGGGGVENWEGRGDGHPDSTLSLRLSLKDAFTLVGPKLHNIRISNLILVCGVGLGFNGAQMIRYLILSKFTNKSTTAAQNLRV